MPASLHLPDVTLLTVTSVNVDEGHAALLRSAEGIDFGAVKMLCAMLPTTSDSRVEYIRIPPLDFLGYSRFIIEALNGYVQTTHCLVVQADGFVRDPARWQARFLEYDYVGAPWPEYVVFPDQGNRRLRLDKNSVGNGGFSLRSKKLLEVTSLLQFDALDFPSKSEDLLICHYLFDEMRAAGIRFAPPEVAAEFSIESVGLYGQSIDAVFGCHGKHWLGRVGDTPAVPAELESMTDVEQAKAYFFEALDLLDRKEYAAAEVRLRDALRIVPDRVSALSNLAVALLEQDKLDEAVDVATRSVTLDPGNAAGWLTLVTSLRRLKRLDEALIAADRALAQVPGDTRLWMGRAAALTEMKAYDQAISNYELVMDLNPNEEDLLGLLVSARMHACDWQPLAAEMTSLLDGIRAGTVTINPFMVLAMPSTAADQLAAARHFTARDHPTLPALFHDRRRSKERIRIAYVSGDFGDHPVARVIAPVFEHHDRTRFEIYALSHGRGDAKPLQERLARNVDHFIDLHDKRDREIAALILAEQIDVAVDLGGFTAGGRPGIFSARPAPVQVTFLGYPGTSGSEYMDYLVADHTVIPPDQSTNYSENVVRLPDAYFPGNRQRASLPPSRTAVGLPDTGFVFCSFSDAYKITPAIFDVWMRLLREVEASVLWLREPNATALRNLRSEAAARGVSPERVIFAKKASIEDHLARHQVAGVFLDTPHYNAHSTASDALSAGLPVLTCTGDTFASRVATSLLLAIDLPELITHSLEEYTALALRLAREPEALAAIKVKLTAHRHTAPLFDTKRFTRHLEAAYATMFERHTRGGAPEAFAVSPLS